MPVRYYLSNCKVYSCDLGGKTLSIEEQAEIAYNYIKSINYKRLVVIGHSMGGLVGGVLCQMCKVDLLITICTPWRGVPVLDYFGFLPRFDYTSFKQMKPDSCFLTTWRNLLHWQPAITVGSNYDLKVPDNYSHLNNSLQITRTLGHNSILLDAGMWALLSVFI
jgi:pimeloyl-ACP methyl ester carboxylesterase